jgi:hypothetical protein
VTVGPSRNDVSPGLVAGLQHGDDFRVQTPFEDYSCEALRQAPLSTTPFSMVERNISTSGWALQKLRSVRWSESG